jgi:outer membrane protein assembly factor BamA
MTLADAPYGIKTPEQLLTQGVDLYTCYTFKHDVRTTHNISLSADYRKIADTVLALNPDYWGSSQKEQLHLGLQYFFRKDNRDFFAYPLKGYYLKSGIQFQASHDLRLLYSQLFINAQYYWKLGNRWFASEALSAGVSLKNKKAYIWDQALGYKESPLRGYEYHVIDGQHFVGINSSLRYNIFPKTVFVLHWLPIPKINKPHFALYATTFLDMGGACHGYAGPDNHLSNQFLYSGGISLDLVTYYDLTFSLCYSMNKQREHGFYFEVNIPLK